MAKVEAWRRNGRWEEPLARLSVRQHSYHRRVASLATWEYPFATLHSRLSLHIL
jgi:hypothetical protein